MSAEPDIDPRNAAADPQDIITPDAFRVAPVLYGLPLASPSRRLAAILIDLLVVAMIAQAGGLLLGVAFAVTVFGALRARSTGSVLGRGLNWMLRSFAALVVFVAAVSILDPVWNWATGSGGRTVNGVQLQATDAVRFAAALARLNSCDSLACRQLAYRELIEVMDRSNASLRERKSALKEIAAEMVADRSERDLLKHMLEEHYAGMTLASASGELPQPLAESGEQAKLLAEDGSFSVLRTLRRIAEEIGFSVGWGAVYFTLLTVIWNGQTLGKRLLGIRVVALNDRPIGYWDAFGRYGGYAAGFATGLLGFLQVYWDPNRQAIQDRISFTAVIRDPDGQTLQRRRAAAAAPATAN